MRNIAQLSSENNLMKESMLKSSPQPPLSNQHPISHVVSTSSAPQSSDQPLSVYILTLPPPTYESARISSIESEDENVRTKIYYLTNKDMVVDEKPLSMMFSRNVNAEIINDQMMINLLVDEYVMLSYKDEDNDLVLIEPTSEDKEDVVITRHPLMTLPFRED